MYLTEQEAKRVLPRLAAVAKHLNIVIEEMQSMNLTEATEYTMLTDAYDLIENAGQGLSDIVDDGSAT